MQQTNQRTVELQDTHKLTNCINVLALFCTGSLSGASEALPTGIFKTPNKSNLAL